MTWSIRQQQQRGGGEEEFWGTKKNEIEQLPLTTHRIRREENEINRVFSFQSMNFIEKVQLIGLDFHSITIDVLIRNRLNHWESYIINSRKRNDEKREHERDEEGKNTPFFLHKSIFHFECLRLFCSIYTYIHNKQ